MGNINDDATFALLKSYVISNSSFNADVLNIDYLLHSPRTNTYKNDPVEDKGAKPIKTEAPKVNLKQTSRAYKKSVMPSKKPAVNDYKYKNPYLADIKNYHDKNYLAPKQYEQPKKTDKPVDGYYRDKYGARYKYKDDHDIKKAQPIKSKKIEQYNQIHGRDQRRQNLLDDKPVEKKID